MYIMMYFSTTKLLFLVLPYNYKSTYTILYYATLNSDDTSMGFQIQSTATSFLHIQSLISIQGPMEDPSGAATGRTITCTKH